MPPWLSELFCPEHGLIVLWQAYVNYWGIWRVAMSVHAAAKQRVVGWFRGN